LKKEKRTIFLNTHNLDEAQRICDRIAILNTKLMAIGTPQELERSVGGRKTVVQLVQVTDAVLAALRKLALGNMTVDGNTLTVDVKDPDSENVVISDAIYGAGGQVKSVTTVGSTLEDAYLKLVRSGNT
jgi:ABC-2 type transport system ATP-binding protein